MLNILWVVISSLITCSVAQLFISPSSQSPPNNGVAIITCSCNNTACSALTWLKNGRKLSNDRAKVIVYHDNRTSILRIQPVRWKVDDGLYSCSNVDNLSEESKLSVHNSDAPPFFPQLVESIPSFQVTSEGVLLSCPSTGDSVLSVTWYKNMVPALLSNGNELLANGSLVVKELSGEGWTYECQVSNQKGSVMSSSLHLNSSVATPENLSVTLLNGAGHVTWQVPSSVRSVSHYKVEYGVEGDASHVQEIVGGNTYTSAILDRGTEYEFMVSAKTVLGWSDKAVARIKTMDGVPLGSPLNISASEISSEGFRLNWMPPLAKHRNGKIIAYEIRERADDKMVDWTVNTTETFYEIRELQPQGSYSFQIRAYTSAGSGPWSSYVQIFTKPESTVQPPRGIKLNRLSPSELEVSWQPVSSHEPVTYEIFATIHATLDLSEWQKRSTTQTSIVFEKAYTSSYAVRVRTLLGSGKFSDLSKVVIETSSYFPDSSKYQPSGPGVRNFIASLVTHGAAQDALLEWTPPEKTKFSHYQINYDGSKFYVDENNSKKEIVLKKQKKVDKNQSKVKVENLHPGTLYKFIVSPCFSEDVCGTSQSVLLSTEARVPPAPTAPMVIKTEGDGGVGVKLRPASGINGAIIKYFLVAVNASLFENRTPDDVTNEEVSHYLQSSADELHDSRLSVFEFKNLPDHFTVRKLPLGIKHKIFLRAFTRDDQFVSSPYSSVVFQPRNPTEEAGNIQSENSKIFFALIPTFFFVVAAILILSCYRHKARKAKKYKEFLKDEHVVMQSEKFISQQTTDFNKPLLPNSGNCRPVSLKNLGKVLEELKRNESSKFREEFEAIDPGQQFTWEASTKEENKAKNRYANVVAYDHTRVKVVNEFTGSDYINANFIDGYCRTKAYIATQGPMQNTIVDFWRMIWDQKCDTIVMVTNIMERNRIKCDQYWPQTTELHGMVYVSLTETATFATYVIRTFQMTNVNTLEKRMCSQYQYTSWPDQGTPSSATSFLNFVKRVKMSKHLHSSPMVVHCSAGVGRTGVFIGVDAMLERMQFEEVIDICAYVTFMRSQRNYMIQTEEQYMFLYEVVYEAVQFGGTEVTADRFLFRVNELFAPIHSRAGYSEVQVEFRKLQNLFTSSTQTLKTNQKNKHRSMIVGDEDKQGFIQNLVDLPNTCLVDSYKDRRAFIATEAPQSGVTDEFWKMLWDFNSSIIVMIAKPKEGGKTLRHQYWPEGRSMRYKYFVVDPVAQYNMPLFTLREFKMTDARDGQSRVVRHFHYIEWPEYGVPPSGDGFIEFIGQIQKTKQQFGLDGPVTVHCSHGDDKTGVFMAVNIILEKLRFEGIIDIFQAMRSIHNQKPSFHPSEEQYRFCYQAVLEYLSSFDHIIS